MITKRSSRKIKIENETTSFKFLKYVPYGESLKYTMLKKIYFKTYDFIIKNKSISLLEFKKIFITIIEKEIENNKRKLFKKEEHYNKIRNSVFKDIEKHYKNIIELDIVDSIYKLSSFKIDLKEYLKTRIDEIKDEYKKNIVNIDFDEIQNVTFKQEYISIQKNIDNSFNLIIVSPYKIIEKMVHKNCYIGTLLRYCSMFLSKELNLKFKNLIVYYPLEITRKIYTIHDIFNYFQEIDWLKILASFKNKLTITTNDNTNCEFCENSKLCFNNNNIIKNKKGGTNNKTLLEIKYD